MTTCNNKLVAIPIENWSDLMKLYKNDWPKNFVTFYTIKNFIDWKNSPHHSGKDEEIKFYSMNDDWSDGTHMIIDNNNHVFFNTLNVNFSSRLIDLIQLLNITKENYYLFIFIGKFESVVTEYLNRNNLIDDGGNPAYLYYLKKEVALNFEIRPPNGYKIKPLLEKHANFVNNLWKYRHPGSEEYLRKLIQRNLQLGIFDENDSLVAWCMRNEYGLLGTLQVIDSHKRMGLGILVTKSLAKLSAQHGYNSGAAMDIKNFPSQKLFEKIGFQKIDKFCYVAPKYKL